MIIIIVSLLIIFGVFIAPILVYPCEFFGHSSKSSLLEERVLNLNEDLWYCPRCGNSFAMDRDGN